MAMSPIWRKSGNQHCSQDLLRAVLTAGLLIQRGKFHTYWLHANRHDGWQFRLK